MTTLYLHDVYFVTTEINDDGIHVPAVTHRFFDKNAKLVMEVTAFPDRDASVAAITPGGENANNG